MIGASSPAAGLLSGGAAEPEGREPPQVPQRSLEPREVPTGLGSSIAHAGELLQGVFEGADGLPHRALVTLPCPALRATARFDPDPAAGEISVEPGWRTKALMACRLTLRHLGREGTGGRLSLLSDIPVRWGFGSSTSDVIAAIRAAAQVCGESLAPEEVARLAVRAETASDAVMFEDRAVLFAQREGEVLEDFGCGLPPLEVVVFNTDPVGEGIDTLALSPADYSWRELSSFRDLRERLRQALRSRDAAAVGAVSSASARINQRHLPKPGLDRIELLAEALGAAGVQVAHSGSLAGLLFDYFAGGKEERIGEARAKIAEMGFATLARFPVCQPERCPS